MNRKESNKTREGEKKKRRRKRGRERRGERRKGTNVFYNNNTGLKGAPKILRITKLEKAHSAFHTQNQAYIKGQKILTCTESDTKSHSHKRKTFGAGSFSILATITIDFYFHFHLLCYLLLSNSNIKHLPTCMKPKFGPRETKS